MVYYTDHPNINGLLYWPPEHKLSIILTTGTHLVYYTDHRNTFSLLYWPDISHQQGPLPYLWSRHEITEWVILPVFLFTILGDKQIQLVRYWNSVKVSNIMNLFFCFDLLSLNDQPANRFRKKTKQKELISSFLFLKDKIYLIFWI